MSPTVRQLESQALQLSAAERADLAQRLFASIEGEDSVIPADVDRAWIEEAERRYQQYLSGATKAVSSADALHRVRSALRQR